MPRPPELGDGAGRRRTRRRLIEARLAQAPDARERASRAIEAALERAFPPGSIGIVAGYWPIRGEFDPRPYLIRCIEAGATAALPVVVGGEPGPLAFRPWRPGAAMEAGGWDVMHPAAGPEVRPDALLIPLVGFDAAGRRLGYGGGYFDRTLAASSPRPRAIGLGFELGRLEEITPGPHDQPMDAVITEAGAEFHPRG